MIKTMRKKYRCSFMFYLNKQTQYDDYVWYAYYEGVQMHAWEAIQKTLNHIEERIGEEIKIEELAEKIII